MKQVWEAGAGDHHGTGAGLWWWERIRVEQGGEEEACKVGRSDLALVRWERWWRLPGKAGGGRKDGGSAGRTPCRTYSYCRHFEPGPYPVRGRGDDRFGYEEIGEEEKKKVEGDTILMLRMWILMVLAQGGRELVGRAWMVKEHPEDPKSYVREEEWQRAKARGACHHRCGTGQRSRRWKSSWALSG